MNTVRYNVFVVTVNILQARELGLFTHSLDSSRMLQLLLASLLLFGRGENT